MTAVERYLRDLSSAVRTRGRARRRLLDECREHLSDSAAIHGDAEAVRRFGDAAELATSFDVEIATDRAVHATVATGVAVVSVGASTVALLNATDPGASAVTAWAVVFFGSAQAAGVCGLLASLRAAAMSHRSATPTDVLLLCRRNSLALAFSALALFAAAAAVPGHASAAAVLPGPVIASVAAVAVLRVRALVRKLGASRCLKVQAPWSDLRAIRRRRHDDADVDVGSSRTPARTLGLTLVIAVICAFVWDRLDYGANGSALSSAGIEAAMVLVGFLLLGPALGLWSARRSTGRGSAR